jgi:hypothetical protein
LVAAVACAASLAATLAAALVTRAARRPAEAPAHVSADDSARVPQPVRRVLREPVERDDAWLSQLLRGLGHRSLTLLADSEAHRVEVMVTEVLPSAGGRRLLEHRYRVDAELFYPASAIKPFVAVAALRHLEELARRHPGLALDTPLRICAIDEARCRDGVDPTNLEGGHITLGHELRKMLLVSSNRAFNRLYDFVGHERLNASLHELGFGSLRLRHRFQGGAEGGRTSPRFELLDGTLLLPQRVSALSLDAAAGARPEIGAAHYDDAGELQQQPADFRFKNVASLRDMQRLLMSLVDPSLPEALPLGLAQRHRDALLAAMREDPRASVNPELKGAQYAMEHYKPLWRGARRVVDQRDLLCVSKSGRAYGFEVDNAYLRHLPSGRAVFVTAAVYADPNKVVNDDGYAYHLTGAFMDELGAALAREVFLAR